MCPQPCVYCREVGQPDFVWESIRSLKVKSGPFVLKADGPDVSSFNRD